MSDLDDLMNQMDGKAFRISADQEPVKATKIPKNLDKIVWDILGADEDRFFGGSMAECADRVIDVVTSVIEHDLKGYDDWLKLGN